MEKIFYILLTWNFIVMFVYGIDKLKAKQGGRRIREATLLTCAFLLGGWGAIFGMIIFNHKTSKIKFRILVPLSVVLLVGTIYFLVVNTSSVFMI